MAFNPLIIKSEFPTYVKLSKNVKDEEINPHIRDAQILDFMQWVDPTFYTDITGSLSSRPELNALLEDYVKQYLICKAFYRFLLWHGRNISPYGIRVNNEETSTEVSDKARAEMMQDVEHKANVYLSMLKDRLRNDNYTYDSIIYSFYDEIGSKKPYPNLTIRQVGQSRRRYLSPEEKTKSCE